jgi:hypothetical protein
MIADENLINLGGMLGLQVANVILHKVFSALQNLNLNNKKPSTLQLH